VFEQAEESIMGPNFEEVSQALKCNDSENLETDNTIIPLSSGTLEIEKAVSSILGETGLSSVEPIVENNAIIVDIKQNTENPTHSAIQTNNHEIETARGIALEDINAINGFPIESENHDTLIDTKHMSENITMKTGNNSHMANTFEGKLLMSIFHMFAIDFVSLAFGWVVLWKLSLLNCVQEGCKALKGYIPHISITLAGAVVKYFMWMMVAGGVDFTFQFNWITEERKAWAANHTIDDALKIFG
jgi:hypothetical protein